MKHTPLPHIDILTERLDYSIVTGKCYWKQRVSASAGKGSEAGTYNRDGYLEVGINGKKYKLSRVIWKLVTGEDPGDLTVEHLDRVRDHNAWHNLTLLTPELQAQNRQHVINSPYPLYVNWVKARKKFRVQKKRNGVFIHDSYHITLKEATEVASTLYGEL